MQLPRTPVVVGGNRTPFAKAGTRYASAGNTDLLTAALDGLVARFAWRRVDRVEADADDLLFWMGPEAILAPRRCFAAQTDFDDFVRAARAWRRAALAATMNAPAS